MDVIEALQYFFKSKNGKTKGGDNATEIGSFCCTGLARKRNSSTSTHDLSTYVWHTEGDGIGLSTSSSPDEEDRCGCSGGKQGSLGARSQKSARCSAEGQGNACDASTSTFDLSTYVWGTQGDMFTTDSGLDEDLDDCFAHDLGDMDNVGKRKRPRAAAARGSSIWSNNDSVAAPPRKKTRIKKD